MTVWPHGLFVSLTLSILKTKTLLFAKSVDPDEMAHLDLHCLPFCCQCCLTFL